VDLFDHLRGDSQASPALRRFPEMAIDLARAPKPGLGGLTDVALAVAIANADVHGRKDTQLRLIVNCESVLLSYEHRRARPVGAVTSAAPARKAAGPRAPSRGARGSAMESDVNEVRT
jgi:hypothetical protein